MNSLCENNHIIAGRLSAFFNVGRKESFSILFTFSLFALVACTASHQEVSQAKNAENRSEAKAATALPQLFQRPFKAAGSEPFWLIEIDSLHTVHFRTLDDALFNFKMPLSPSNIEEKEGETIARCQSEKGKLLLIIKDEKCKDSMDRQVNSHLVKVVYTNNESKEWHYEACGHFKEK